MGVSTQALCVCVSTKVLCMNKYKVLCVSEYKGTVCVSTKALCMSEYKGSVYK